MGRQEIDKWLFNNNNNNWWVCWSSWNEKHSEDMRSCLSGHGPRDLRRAAGFGAAVTVSWEFTDVLRDTRANGASLKTAPESQGDWPHRRPGLLGWLQGNRATLTVSKQRLNRPSRDLNKWFYSLWALDPDAWLTGCTPHEGDVWESPNLGYLTF